MDNEQMQMLKSFTVEQIKSEAQKKISSGSSDYQSANESDEFQMRLDSSPFKPATEKVPENV